MKPDRRDLRAVLGPSTALVFPGQGAQYFRMGEALFQKDEAFTGHVGTEHFGVLKGEEQSSTKTKTGKTFR